MESDFWNSEKIYLVGALEKRILADQESVSWGQIKKLDLPEILRSTLLNQAKVFFKTEKPLRIIQNERFDFSLPQLKSELTTLREVFLETVLFSAEEVSKAIQFSVNLGFDIITQPQKTCLSILFDISLERSQDDIYSILRGLSIGSPFVKSLIEYFEVSEKEQIQKIHFKQISAEIQQVLYGENPLEVIVEEIKLLLDFYTDIGDDMEDNLSSEIVHGMLRERGLDDFAQNFNKAATEKPFWNLAEIEDFLTLNAGRENKTSESPTIFSVKEDDEQDVDAIGIEEETISPLDQEFLPVSDDIDSDDLYDAILEEPQDEQTPIEQDDALQLDDATLSEVEKHTLYTLIDERTQSEFQRNIFAGNAEAYDAFIEYLENQDDWHAAKAVMDKEFKERQLSSFSREAIKFGDILFKRFISKGRY
ncbi:MAG: hypothetical protein DWQ05_03670 [Calditrichaeota bacterium]|nr:MAG: hypothetical protein DWQ05_03670 [Calditrichota bacterium]